MKKKAEKKAQSEELRAQLATVSTVILSTFQGITVEQDTQLRRSVEAAGATLSSCKEHRNRAGGPGHSSRVAAQGSERHEFNLVHEN